jgi:hypothetical protein
MARKDRLKEVYEYVRKNYPIHTQTDFADALRYNRAYISSAMHGNERYLTDNLFKNICEAYPGTFNLDYLLTGNGTLLASGENEQKTTTGNKTPVEVSNSGIDISSVINAVIAASDSHIETLRSQLKVKDEQIVAMSARIKELSDTITSLHTYIATIQRNASMPPATRQPMVPHGSDHHPSILSEPAEPINKKNP